MSGGHLPLELLRGERLRGGADGDAYGGVKGSFECHVGGAVRLGGVGGVSEEEAQQWPPGERAIARAVQVAWAAAVDLIRRPEE